MKTYKRDVSLNPNAIVEISSKSTKFKERNANPDSYTALESLFDDILFGQEMCIISSGSTKKNGKSDCLAKQTIKAKNL